MRGVVYTANYGDYDKRLELVGSCRSDFKALYFTEPEFGIGKGWERAEFNAPQWWNDLIDPAKAKIIKINPWLAFGDDWDVCIWVDGNIEVTKSVSSTAKHLKGDFVTTTQPTTDSFYKELDLVSRHRRPYLDGLRDQISSVIKWHKKNGTPNKDSIGGICTRFILRRNTESCKDLCEKWMERFIAEGIWRDQVALRGVGHNHECEVRRVNKGICGVRYSCSHDKSAKNTKRGLKLKNGLR